MNQQVNGMAGLGGTLIILGFISWAFYDIAYITPMIFVLGGVLLFAGIISGDSK